MVQLIGDIGCIVPTGKKGENPRGRKKSTNVNCRLFTTFNDYKTVSENVLVRTSLYLKNIYLHIHKMKLALKFFLREIYAHIAPINHLVYAAPVPSSALKKHCIPLPLSFSTPLPTSG